MNELMGNFSREMQTIKMNQISPASGWLKKLCYIYTVKYYSARKRDYFHMWQPG